MTLISNTAPVRLRWFNVQNFEIQLANGRTILIDPQISDPIPTAGFGKKFKIPEKWGLSKEDVKACDYILLNHSHCDHCVDLGYMANKFHALVICHSAIAYEAARAFDIPFTQMYPMEFNQKCELDGVTVRTFHGTHMPQPFTASTMGNIMLEDYGLEGQNEFGQMGGVYSMNYLLTTRENFGIAFIAGQHETFSPDTARQMAEFHPTILLRQIPGRDLDTEAARLAADLMTTGAQYLLPMHHESLEIEAPEKLVKLFDEVNVLLEKEHYAGKAIIPVRGQWYTFGTSVMSE